MLKPRIEVILTKDEIEKILKGQCLLVETRVKEIEVFVSMKPPKGC